MGPFYLIYFYLTRIVKLTDRTKKIGKKDSDKNRSLCVFYIIQTVMSTRKTKKHISQKADKILVPAEPRTTVPNFIKEVTLEASAFDGFSQITWWVCKKCNKPYEPSFLIVTANEEERKAIAQVYGMSLSQIYQCNECNSKE